VFGVWQRGPDGTLVVSHPGRATKRALAAIATEGRRLLRLLEPDAGSRDVRFVRID
jgi:hypothetical protein